jgi:hypothetical protein
MTRIGIVIILIAGSIGLVAARQREMGPGALETLRLNGLIRAEGGGPLSGARIKTDALRGPGGSQFAGQRVFNVRANRNGEWALLGVTRGLWVFEVNAPEHWPHVVVVPIHMMTRPEPVPWETNFALMPHGMVKPGGPTPEVAVRSLRSAADAALSGDRKGAREALMRLVELSLDAPGLCAAGDVALLMREPLVARRFFDAAAAADPSSYRPQLGIASSSMMLLDFDRAIKAYDVARAGTSDERIQRMLSSAVREIQQIRTIGKY